MSSVPPQNPGFSTPHGDAVVAAYASGEAAESIAARFGLTVAAVEAVVARETTVNAEAAAGSRQSAPAGWYADPGNSSAQRWWDGQQWTDVARMAPALAQPVTPPAYANLYQASEPHDGTPSTGKRRIVAITAGVAAVALLAGGAIAAVASYSAKSELCDIIGSQDAYDQAGGDEPDSLGKIEAVAERIHTLAGRLVFSGELKDASVGFADSLQTMVTYSRAGLDDTATADPATADRMNDIALSGVENLSQMQRSCELAVTGRLGEGAGVTAEMADKSAQSDVRGAVSEVEQYYTDMGNFYPNAGLAGDNRGGSTPQLALDGSARAITLSENTQLYYVPASGSTYRICATNTGGSGKWYAYDSARGGSVEVISPPADPTLCA
ncbi:DUF2510 domain-containing protein [Actinoplanes sp. LDG1-06]|uniref:DUF2510 domain-containing protein n=1 Tax=Paractinoplanes ovalisporus TaxID=2810368 RepID=A0ABS2A404_9ACTN|nr:DUF2510 domain-containing protein [Actinoplanes ovalisporus]MBM2614578.1 DUF2510 domain-containing protein [Actinoplanes ovalisporus]